MPSARSRWWVAAVPAAPPSTSASIQGVAAAGRAHVQYGGSGSPDAVIVSDLPLRGDSAQRSSQQVDAIKLALDQAGWKAGDLNVGFQSCDDSIAKTGLWDAHTCTANAKAYAADKNVLGVIGTYNSGCAALEIPILNKASVAMISPGNTAVCLTEESPICSDYSPKSLYPTGTRNYVRVVPNDAFQAAGLAQFAKSQGVEKPFVLYASDDPTSTGQAVNFRGAARQLGMTLAGYKIWNQKAKNYTALMQSVANSGADGVILAGLIEENGGQVIRDKVASAGSNQALPLFAFDGFSSAVHDRPSRIGHTGMYASVPGRSPDALTGDGATPSKI